MTDLIKTETDGGVSVIRFNRPDKKNALNVEMYDGLVKALITAEADDSVRVVVLTGAGDAYTSGNDINDFLNVPRDPNTDSPGIRFLKTLARFEKPVIAAVNGLAVGVGSTMLLHCDLVYAAQSAGFHMPFVDLAVVPEAASSMLLPRMMGHHRAAELILLAEPYGAEKAYEVGLVNEIVPDGELMDTVLGKAGQIAAKAPAAVRESKRLLKMADQSIEERMAEELRAFAAQLHSAEAREVMEAFIEKRPPDFSKLA